MNPLNRDPSSAEATLLDVIYEAFLEYGQWPHFQYVDNTLYNMPAKLDAQQLLLECPRISIAPVGIGHYGWLRSSNPTLSAQLPSDQISLTVAGLSHLPQAGGLVTAFLKTLAFFLVRERSIKPSPIAVQTVTVTSEDVRLQLSMGLQNLDPKIVDWIGDALQHEPSTWGCSIQRTDDSGWTTTPGSFLRRYEGVKSASDYLDRLLGQLQPSWDFETSEKLQGDAASSHEYHFFISHASEDKDAIARPLYEELGKRGFKVWFDEAVLVVGQSLVESIDHGLANCDHGIVIVSPAFFAKKWPALRASWPCPAFDVR